MRTKDKEGRTRACPSALLSSVKIRWGRAPKGTHARAKGSVTPWFLGFLSSEPNLTVLAGTRVVGKPALCRALPSCSEPCSTGSIPTTGISPGADGAVVLRACQWLKRPRGLKIHWGGESCLPSKKLSKRIKAPSTTYPFKIMPEVARSNKCPLWFFPLLFEIIYRFETPFPILSTSTPAWELQNPTWSWVRKQPQPTLGHLS